MFITVEEMYALRAEYDKQILELEMKKSVVGDLIAIAEAKAPVETETENEAETEEVEPNEFENV